MKNGKVYEFQPDNTGGWHGYIIESTELVGQKGGVNLFKQWLQEGKISKSAYKKLIKGK